MAQLKIKEIPLTTFNSASLTGTYQAINPLGLPNPCFLLRIINGGTTSVNISYDGVTDHDVVFFASTLQLPGPINTLLNSNGALFPHGQIVYIRGTAGTGSIGVAGYYQST